MDVRVFLYLHHAFAPLVTLFAVLSAIGGGWGAVFVVVPLAWRASLRPMARSLVYTLAVNACLVFGLKRIVARARPCHCLDGVQALVFRAPTDYSFPSGHAAGSFAFAVFLSVIIVRRTTWPTATRAVVVGVLLAFAVGVALSRIALGVHFPGDVLAGAVVGATVGGVGAGLHMKRERAVQAPKSPPIYG